MSVLEIIHCNTSTEAGSWYERGPLLNEKLRFQILERIKWSSEWMNTAHKNPNKNFIKSNNQNSKQIKIVFFKNQWSCVMEISNNIHFTCRWICMRTLVHDLSPAITVFYMVFLAHAYYQMLLGWVIVPIIQN